MRKCLPVNSTIRLKLPEKTKEKRQKKEVKNKLMLISFQCQTLPAFGHQLRQQQQLTKELKPFSVYVMQEQNKNADKLRRVTNKQTQRQPQEPQSQSQWHSCNVSAADTVSQRYAYAALGHCVKLDSPPAAHLLLVPYIYQHTCVCICVCV